ncbi:probable methyltransferase PMT23 [Fagus crenata]
MFPAFNYKVLTQYIVIAKWPCSYIDFSAIWYDNVPHPKLVEYKKDQNWVRKSGDYLVFPGGGTQFKDGVISYVEFIERTLPTIEWGRHIRVILDVGCGVASFGGYLLDKDVITMSFAPKDEHEAQIQFALERGIPATLSVIGTQKLTFSDNAYDLIHYARRRVHWDADAMVALTKSMCWKVVARTVDSSGNGLVIYQKPVSTSCYLKRKDKNPPLCEQNDRKNSSWYVALSRCLSPLPVDSMGNLFSWPMPWPKRLISKPPSLSTESAGAEEMFYEDTKHWSALVSDVYLNYTINWSSVRNVMDMNAHYGGCDVIDVVVEIDRILRPGGYIVGQDTVEMINKLSPILHSLHWSLTLYKDQFLVGKKGLWHPNGLRN